MPSKFDQGKVTAQNNAFKFELYLQTNILPGKYLYTTIVYGLTHIVEDAGEVPHSDGVGIGGRSIHGAHASHDVTTTTTATTCQAHRSLPLPGTHHMSLRRSPPPPPSLSLATTPLTPSPVRPSRGYVHTTGHAVGAGVCVRVACVCLTLGAKTAHLHWSPLLSCVCVGSV